MLKIFCSAPIYSLRLARSCLLTVCLYCLRRKIGFVFSTHCSPHPEIGCGLSFAYGSPTVSKKCRALRKRPQLQVKKTHPFKFLRSCQHLQQCQPQDKKHFGSALVHVAQPVPQDPPKSRPIQKQTQVEFFEFCCPSPHEAAGLPPAIVAKNMCVSPFE